MRQWLARLAFSCFIIAGVLAWEAHKTRNAESWRPVLYLIAAMLAVLLGLAGVRERHRAVRDDRDELP